MVPVYSVIDPKGAEQGQRRGQYAAQAGQAAVGTCNPVARCDRAASGVTGPLFHIQAAMQHADPNSLS